MCSTPGQRIAEIGKAIDDLAAEALAAYAPAGARPSRIGGQPGHSTAAEHLPTESARPGHADEPTDVSDGDQVVIRLARLWELLAELDPEVARRLPRYQA